MIRLMLKVANPVEVGVGVEGAEVGPLGRARSQRVAPPKVLKRLYSFNRIFLFFLFSSAKYEVLEWYAVA